MSLERILIVDDDAEFAKACKEQLLSIQTVKEVDTIESGVTFFKQFMSKDYSLVVLEYILRDIDGLQILIEMKEKEIKLPVVIITGKGDESVAVDCFRQGAIDYIIKDFNNIKSLKERIQDDYNIYYSEALKDKKLSSLKSENEKLAKQVKEISEGLTSIKKENTVLKGELKSQKEKINRIKTSHESIIFALLYALDKSPENMAGHSALLLSQSLATGREMNIDDSELEKIRLTAYLVNIGASGINQSDLIIDDELNEEQLNRLKIICEGGADIVNTQNKLSEIARNVLYQFERWDGKGYPFGLAKNEIPISSRIVQVVKAYDILVRIGYQKTKFAPDDALKMINQRAGTYYDPNVVFAFSKVIKPNK